MSTIATTIAGPKTYSAEELQALHLAMNAKAKNLLIILASLDLHVWSVIMKISKKQSKNSGGN